MKQAITIAMVNEKGGVAKSSTAISVGCILSSKGYHVLLVDLDPQANLTASLLEERHFDETIYTALMGTSPLPQVPATDNLWIVPSNVDMTLAETGIYNKVSREYILKRLLEQVKESYDFIILDCSPSLGQVTLNALTASDEVVIPLIPEVLPFQGLKNMMEYINMVKDNVNPDIHVTGILLTRYEFVTIMRDIENGLRSFYGDLIFKTRIRKNTDIAKAPKEHLDIVRYAPKSNGAFDYTQFTEELLTRLTKYT